MEAVGTEASAGREVDDDDEEEEEREEVEAWASLLGLRPALLGDLAVADDDDAAAAMAAFSALDLRPALLLGSGAPVKLNKIGKVKMKDSTNEK